jgi:hypothetical protein
MFLSNIQCGLAQTIDLDMIRYLSKVFAKGPDGRAAGKEDLVNLIEVHVVGFDLDGLVHHEFFNVSPSSLEPVGQFF